jgi:hypothetical protein
VYCPGFAGFARVRLGSPECTVPGSPPDIQSRWAKHWANWPGFDRFRANVRQARELTEYGSNERLLKQVSAFTGGRFNPTARQVFDPGNRTVASTLRLWPGLLVAALLLNLIELVLRKWRGLAASFLGKRDAGR